MNTQKTYGVKDEELPWRALADAVIVQAVKDYQICSQRIRQIQNRLHRRTGITSAEAIEQKGRLRRYLGAQDAIRDFFFSPRFHVLSDLDGRKLLERLDQEVL